MPILPTAHVTRARGRALLVLLAVALVTGYAPGSAAVPPAPEPAPGPPPVLMHQAVPYDDFCDAEGLITDAQNVWRMLNSPGQLDSIYADAVNGDARATRFLVELESLFEDVGHEVADQATSVPCTLTSVLPGCRPNWSFLGFLAQGGLGEQRLLTIIREAYSERARKRGMENAVLLSSINALTSILVVNKALAGTKAEARALASEDAAVLRRLPEEPAGRKPPLPDRPALALLAEAAGATEESLAAKLGEAEAEDTGRRMPATLDALEKLRPPQARPASVPQLSDRLWKEYAAYWNERFNELTRQERAGVPRELRHKPPLTWEAYEELRGRFARAIAYQRKVTAKLREQGNLDPDKRTLFKKLRRVRVDENLGVLKDGWENPCYVDQLVSDEATLQGGEEPHVESFSTKQRDLTRLSEREAGAVAEADALEAHRKYGGTVEVRRPGHPLFKKKIKVDKVHLVYDAQLKPVNPNAVKAMEKAASRLGVEVHFQ